MAAGDQLLTVRAPGRAPHFPGDEITVGWPVEAAVVVKETDEDPPDGSG